MRYVQKSKNIIALQLLLLVSTIFAFDTIAYLFAPNSIAWKYYYYRMASDFTGQPASYPPHYYVTHNQRGYDIGKQRKNTHNLPETSYPIWSNGLGCFDREWQDIPKEYVYFAGDSFTWGLSNLENKFTSVFEKITKRPSLKCGVSLFIHPASVR